MNTLGHIDGGGPLFPPAFAAGNGLDFLQFAQQVDLGCFPLIILLAAFLTICLDPELRDAEIVTAAPDKR
jgi:hypothetical protein